VAELSLPFTIGLGLPALAIQSLTVALARGLRVYSRSRLERICAAKGRPSRADSIARHDEETERAAESLAIMSGLVIASLAGGTAAQVEPPAVANLVVATVLGIALICYVAAAAIGRVFAERLLDAIWPIAPVVRTLASPLTLVGFAAEWIAQQIGGHDDAPPRPASVEVEIPPDDDNPEADEPDLPESIRAMLEHVVELTRRDVSELMVPRSRMEMRPATISARDAANVFRTTGLSRIPVYGENRDDIVGILYAKDLFPALLDAADPAEVSPRRLARPAYFIPESKAASELLEDLRSRRLQIAIVLDEYGGVAGLITLEDVIEELVGPIDDEHDQPSPSDPIVPLGEGSYEVDATLPLEELNERLGLQLPTEDDITTVGGYVFHALGRLPEPGATFRRDGIEFTILEVADHSIRRMRLELIGQANRASRQN
jgi:CBS domain containing-hemolysin-like protein